MDPTLFEKEPVLAVCGWSGSGKTTLLEEIVPLLVNRGLRIGVVKHDAHGVMVDLEGKDSARLFAAGADVHLRSPQEQMVRTRHRVEDSLGRAILNLLGTQDLVLVEGHKDTPLPKIWCHSQGTEELPEGVSGIIVSLPWDSERVSTTVSIIDKRVGAVMSVRPLFGGVLIGGKSRRMGRPKHMETLGGRSLLSRVEQAFRPMVERVVVLGRGAIPQDVGPLDQLGDAPGSGEGPLAGLMTAFRWAPRASWVIGACDMPGINVEAVQWLLEQRRPGCWAVIPRDTDGRLHPTLALYEPQAAVLIDALVEGGRRAPRALAEWTHVHTPPIPLPLVATWTNVNTPEELQAFQNEREINDG